MSYLFKTLTNMNDVELTLSPQENRQIHQHILQRTNTNRALWMDEERPPFITTTHDGTDGVGIQFNCYLKSFGSTLIILVVPSSVKDVKQLIGNDIGESLNLFISM